MNQTCRQRLWLRAAREITAQYQQLDTALPTMNSLPAGQWEQVNRLTRLMVKARAHKYPTAFWRCFHELQRTLLSLMREIAAYRGELTQIERQSNCPSFKETYAELCSLPDEFEETRIDWSEQEIVVRTSTVILDQINLGEFEIRLRWSELDCPQPYRIISLAETGADDVHHPHVQENTLCEGEGKYPISQALAAGRLSDFFLLVQQILQTYNPGSAYVPLDRWGNASCADCGDSVSREDSRACSTCEHQICEDCCRSCTTCDDLLCSSCADTCSECDNTFCRSCLSTCDSCGTCCCEQCLCDQSCSTCLEELTENEDDASENTTTDAPSVTSPSSETPAT
tara:strand:+ start:5704 stop:6726 length:1023 start_codon:yes stop_codon:yes gene_type:complete